MAKLYMRRDEMDPNKEESPLVVDMAEANNALRPDLGASSEDKEPIVEVEDQLSTSREEIARGGERPAETSKETATSPAPGEDVRRALSTIESLKQGQERLERDLLEARQTRRDREEPEIEMVEVFPNVRLPKDPSRRPIQLTPDQYEAIGLDGKAAPGLNVLANALYVFMSNTLTGLVSEQVDTRIKSREDRARGAAAFYQVYPDLVGNEDLLELTERRARREGVAQGKSDDDYAKEIARRTRTRLAGYQGITLEEYEARLERPSNTTPPSPPARIPSQRSRATTTTPGSRARVPAPNPREAELLDMFEE